MTCRTFQRAIALLGLLCGMLGCRTQKEYYFHGEADLKHERQVALEIDYPNVATSINEMAVSSQAPRTLDDPRQDEMWDLTLDEALRVTLANSKIIHDLGARVLTAPAGLQTVYDPAIRESDYLNGVEAALSAFDAQFSSSLFWESNDRVQNRFIPGFIQPVFQQDVGRFRSELSKYSATGGRFALRNNTDYDWNNNPGNLFPSAWNTNIEAEVRHPLLQGAGVEFNRIAGVSTDVNNVALSNGVLVARINTDVTLADFETGVRNLVSDVENAYWDLYFAYRDLDAKVSGQNSALETWRKIESLAEVGQRGGEADKEAQAREQFYRFRGLVQNALSGLQGGSTVSGGGSAAGTFRAAGGVYARENNLRFLMGLPPNDGRLIRPIDEPSMVKVAFAWDEILPEALQRRVELRRQKWIVQRRELELVASRNYLLPRLDAVSQYRWRGFGDNLLHPNGPGGFDNAVQNLTEGDFQEWQLGLQFNAPIGFRRQMAAVRNAELLVSRERAILRDQEMRVVHDLSGAIRELERAYEVAQTNLNRGIAAAQEVRAVQDAFEVGTATIDVLLEAQRRASEATSDYYRSLVEYNLAIKGVHFEKGSMLEYDGIFLTEGGWSQKAHCDAREQARKFVPRSLNYQFHCPPVLSQGNYDQHAGLDAEKLPAPPEEHFLLDSPTPTDAPPKPPEFPSDASPEKAAGLPKKAASPVVQAAPHPQIKPATFQDERKDGVRLPEGVEIRLSVDQVEPARPGAGR